MKVNLKLDNISTLIRNVFLMMSLFVLMLVSGCMTSSLVNSDPIQKRSTTNASDKMIGSDLIYAVGTPQQPELLKNFPNAIAIVGEKNTYVVTHGDVELRKLLGGLDPTRIILNPDQQSGEHAIRLDLGDGKFKAAVKVLYNRSVDEMSSEEKSVIIQFGFTQENVGSTQRFAKTFYFDGFLAPRAENIDSIKSRFSKPRTVELHELQWQTTSVDQYNPAKYIALPFAIAIDVMTSPLQALFFLGNAAASQPH